MNISGCSLDIANNTNGAHMPLIINPKSLPAEFVFPTRGSVVLKKQESIILACSGKRNRLENGKLFSIFLFEINFI